jgi:hypothetical protein
MSLPLRKSRRSGPILALQCIGSTPVSGRRQFITVKIDLLISPAYSVPAMTMVRSAKERAMAVPLRTPSVSGSAWNSGAWQDHVIRRETGQLIDGRADEHVAGEQRVPGICGDEAHAYSVGRIGPGKQVLREQLAPLQIGLHPRLQHGEFAAGSFW